MPVDLPDTEGPTRAAIQELVRKACTVVTRLRDPADEWAVYELVRCAIHHLCAKHTFERAARLGNEGLNLLSKSLEEAQKNRS